ncbi:MAG: class II glutamine amidotransferase [Pseudomonadota bacterium]|nr:class II glutamine amidotransferase [Pseudomonadota bacterium]
MCQLLGLSASGPVAADFSLGGFLQRGGCTDHHSDGWGLGWYQGRQCQVLADELPAAHSPLARSVLAGSLRSASLIAHVRKATQGRIRLSNCHPFRRNLWERDWLFAHNGHLRQLNHHGEGPYFACGDTDSEPAFCALLNGLFRRFGAVEPGSAALAQAVGEISAVLSAHGPFNFLMSNGELLFARCSTELHYVERAWPFGRAHLVDTGAVIDFALHNHRHDRVAVVATRPLTSDEPWQRLAPGELQVFVRGRRVAEWAQYSDEPVHVGVPPAIASAPCAHMVPAGA